MFVCYHSLDKSYTTFLSPKKREEKISPFLPKFILISLREAAN